MPDICKGDFYLVLRRKRGWTWLQARLTSKPPSLAPGERAVKIKVEVPAALFLTPAIEAKVIVPESAVSAPVIKAEVLDNIQQLVEQQLGMKLQISVVEPTEVEE
jgi:hypothetical protein